VSLSGDPWEIGPKDIAASPDVARETNNKKVAGIGEEEASLDDI
jgi:hypothetical protein